MTPVTATRLAADEVRFRAMGTDVHLLAVGGPTGALADARALVHQLDRRWTRFRDDSELARLNRAAGRPVLLPADTYDLVATAVAAWAETGGRFDPTVGPALVANGYDRTFAALPPPGPTADLTTPASAARPPSPAPGCGGIELDDALSAVTLPAGTALDLGGIGKGRAGDLVVEALLAAGAEGALANLGGDVRVAGTAPLGDAWGVTVLTPGERGPEPVALASLADGAVATTSAAVRRWATAAGDAHHLIDPRTGRPADRPLRSATVLAADATRADVLTKAAWLAGPDEGAALVEATGAVALFVHADGHTTTAGPAGRFLS